MARILAIDYGTKRTGIAVSDPTQTIAGALDTVATHELRAWLQRYVASNDVSTIVVGLPTQMNGRPSESAAHIDPFVGWLEREFPDKTIARHDERFTSVLARRAILESGIGRMARRDKALVDRVSATIILQSYMDRRSPDSDP